MPTTDPEKTIVHIPHPSWRIFVDGFIGGIGWALGATVGFALLAIILGWFLQGLGGVPVIGEWLADLISTIQQSLER